MVMTDNNEPRKQTPGAPPRSLVVFIVASACLSVIFFLLVLACPLNVAKVDEANSAIHQHVFFLTTTTMFIAGMTGGCLSNIRRIIQHSAPGPFNTVYSLSYYLRPLFGGIAGIVVFFLLLGGALSLNVGSAGTATGWTTLTGRAPFITFALLAGFGSTEVLGVSRTV